MRFSSVQDSDVGFDEFGSYQLAVGDVVFFSSVRGRFPRLLNARLQMATDQSFFGDVRWDVHEPAEVNRRPG